MITRRYEVDNLIGVEINLGRVGENGARTIEFDVRPWMIHHPNGFIVVYVVPPAPQGMCRPPMHGRPPKNDGYIAMTTYDDGIVSWVVTSNDTQMEGNGAVELILYGQDNEVLQSTVVKTKVSRSLAHNGGHGCGCGPNPNQPWVDQVARMAMTAQDAAERAEAAAENVANIALENTIPGGGETNQVLGKLSDFDRDIGWIDLPKVEVVEQKPYVINRATRYDFPSVGDVEVIYKAEQEGLLYQWNSTALKYELLGESEITVEDITIIHGGNAYGTA